MATNVVVIDSTARRATVKTSPGTYLSDVLSEACAKLNTDASQYGLKHNNKQIDLSRTIRLSGLTSGAKLELVQLSKSAGVVSVALQLPPSEVKEGQNPRITDKLPSTTTLWLLLRKFESGLMGAGPPVKRNLTARGVPSTSTGQGRLFYEQPVLNVMGRELSNFADLQKTLAQLGLNSGSVLVKLSYRTSDQPLEEAMAQIQEYFDKVDPQPEPPALLPEPETAMLAATIKPKIEKEWEHDDQMQGIERTPQPEASLSTTQTPPDPRSDLSSPTTTDAQVPQPTPLTSEAPISVFRPPTSSGVQTYNESDYIPTIEHATAHQKLLTSQTRNKQLLSDAQIAAQEKEEAERLARIQSVEIKIRFPDLLSAHVTVSQSDTGANLYEFVRERCLSPNLKPQKFNLVVPGAKGSLAIQDNTSKTLIRGLGLSGRVLVVFSWDEAAPETVRNTRSVLRPEIEAAAKVAAPVEEVNVQDEDEGRRVVVKQKEEKKDGDEKGKGKGAPKWLRGLVKK